MIKAVPFIQTIGTEKFKEFLLQPFKTEQLDSNNDSQVLFDGWEFTDEETYFNKIGRITLNFHSTFYLAHRNDANYKLPIPKTVDDFVNDMMRVGIEIYWSDLFDENFEPKDYLHKDEIRNYFETLLNKMGKYNELK
jgi:hypothetical protein